MKQWFAKLVHIFSLVTAAILLVILGVVCAISYGVSKLAENTIEARKQFLLIFKENKNKLKSYWRSK